MGHDSEEDDEVAEIFVCIECGVTVALQSQRHTDKRRAWRDIQRQSLADKDIERQGAT